MNKLMLGAALGLAALLAGCRSAWYGARFVPAPLETRLQSPDDPDGQARALATVRGIRRAVPKQGRPVEVEVLLRIDNLGAVPVRLLADGFDLVSADLVSFRAPRIEPPAGEALEPGASRTWTLAFGLPEGKRVEGVDWGGLNLRWSVAFDGRVVVTGVTFDRWLTPDYHYGYDPFWPGVYPYRSHVHFGVGVGGTFEE